jgi:hypothetical protein
MNKSKMLVIAGFLFLAFVLPLNLKANANTKFAPNDSIQNIQLAEANALLYRLKEIKKTDKSKMTSIEKKELKKEAKAIKREFRTNDNGGIYLSVGAIIIIILVLILLL